eukprot:3490477-Amphidinium_carterae.1
MSDEHKSAWRASAPPPPTVDPGATLKQARKRYEREWAMELQDIDPQRMSAADIVSPKKEPRVSKNSTVPRATGEPSYPPHNYEKVKKSKRQLWFITKKGLKVVPKGRTRKYRVVGRPPARILKRKKDPDVAEEFSLKDKKNRKANLGSGLTYQEARDHWIKWAYKNRKSGRVLEATSPARADVDAAFEKQESKRKNFGKIRQKQGRSRLPQSTMDKDEF